MVLPVMQNGLKRLCVDMGVAGMRCACLTMFPHRASRAGARDAAGTGASAVGRRFGGRRSVPPMTDSGSNTGEISR